MTTTSTVMKGTALRKATAAAVATLREKKTKACGSQPLALQEPHREQRGPQAPYAPSVGGRRPAGAAFNYRCRRGDVAGGGGTPLSPPPPLRLACLSSVASTASSALPMWTPLPAPCDALTWSRPFAACLPPPPVAAAAPMPPRWMPLRATRRVCPRALHLRQRPRWQAAVCHLPPRCTCRHTAAVIRRRTWAAEGAAAGGHRQGPPAGVAPACGGGRMRPARQQLRRRRQRQQRPWQPRQWRPRSGYRDSSGGYGSVRDGGAGDMPHETTRHTLPPRTAPGKRACRLRHHDQSRRRAEVSAAEAAVAAAVRSGCVHGNGVRPSEEV